MSYSIHAYLTDSEKVTSVYGSGNQNIFDELYTSLKNDLDSLDNYFSDSLEPPENAFEVLKDFINGVVRFPNIPYMYGYVYEKICEYYGEEIYNAEYLWELEAQSAFVPILFSADFPHIISIKKHQLQDKKKKYLSLKEGEGIGDYDYNEEIEDLIFILDTAIEKSSDLVLYVY
jgi:hypothetical protein